MNLTEEQIERYSRQIILPEVGGEGQGKLLAGKVLIIGAGGLGSPVSLYLAAAGVGTIGLMDGDEVDLSNLQRQIMHFTDDVGVPKVESGKAKMGKLNPDVNVVTYKERFTAANGLDILKDYDFVIDGTDSFASKFLIADACHFAGKPYNHAGILGFSGQTITVNPGVSACYRCVFREPPPAGAVPTCSQAGVLGAVAGVIGTLQANEALKFFTEAGTPLYDKILVFDALLSSFRTINVKRSKNCPLCGDNPSITELVEPDVSGEACSL
jgi:molybdopterin/thiamine biosynthesis adenylyltransferase